MTIGDAPAMPLDYDLLDKSNRGLSMGLNVGVWWLPLETTIKYPQWRWTDEQWAFKTKWFNCCHKKRDAYLILPLFPEFNADSSVILKLRKRWQNDILAEKKIENWKKATVKQMLEFYDLTVKADKNN